jgi:NTP pyrophosphatase (non-canonical NTP hydrolase)
MTHSVEETLTLEEVKAKGEAMAQTIYDGILNCSVMMHEISKARGWYHTLDADGNKVAKVRNIAEMLALIHSEVSEALEADRKGNHENFAEELADAVIRIFDLAVYKNVDIAKAIVQKAQKNMTRKDHDLQERSKPGGKAY